VAGKVAQALYFHTCTRAHYLISSCRDREREWERDTGNTLAHLHTVFVVVRWDREREWESDTGNTLAHYLISSCRDRGRE